MTHVHVPEYPLFPSEAIAPNPALLDQLASGYTGPGGAPPSITQFLFGTVALWVFERIFGAPPGQTQRDAPALLWLMHLSGYFGGVWLRYEIRRAQPDNSLMKAGLAPTEAAFDAMAERASEGLVASRSASRALAFSQRALPELVANFGYNRGYLLEILESPPRGVEPRTGCVTPGGFLWCDYAPQRLSFLPELRSCAEELLSSPPEHLREVAAPLPEAERAAEQQGHRVWSTGLSVEGFTSQAFDQLVDVSCSFLEVIQATALTTGLALSRREAVRARRAALANAALAPWLGSYGMGLMDPSHDAKAGPELPRFE